MALTAPFSSPLLLPYHRHHGHLNRKANPTLSFRGSRIRAAGNIDLLGDFGARDPFPAEVESRFGEKVLGNACTEHKILIPNLSAISLSQQQCAPLSPFQASMTADEAQKLLKKVGFQYPYALNTD
jgi:4a-hydroxytetrahydrobiopterin dehydratase